MSRVPPLAIIALACAASLAACARVHVERGYAVPARPSAVQAVPGGGAVVTPGIAPAALPPSAVIVR